jgi:hypothetical protein
MDLICRDTFSIAKVLRPGSTAYCYQIIYSSIRFNQQRTANVSFTYLLLIEKDDRDAATESIWIMDLLCGMACQMQGGFAESYF